jgi:hypothetical protein
MGHTINDEPDEKELRAMYRHPIARRLNRELLELWERRRLAESQKLCDKEEAGSEATSLSGSPR